MLNAYYSNMLSFTESDKPDTPGIIFLTKRDLVCIIPVNAPTFRSVVLDGKDIVAIIGLAKKSLRYDQALEIMNIVKGIVTGSE